MTVLVNVNDSIINIVQLQDSSRHLVHLIHNHIFLALFVYYCNTFGRCNYGPATRMKVMIVPWKFQEYV